ncbi:TPA: hypothetical protein ACNOH6_004330, partial [Enterobacter hormaechei]
KLCNKKVINNIAGLGTAFSSNGILNLLVRNLYKYSQREADYIFFQNKEDYSIFQQLGIKNSLWKFCLAQELISNVLPSNMQIMMELLALQ